MESPSSTERRQAWIKRSRQAPIVEELDSGGQLSQPPSASIADDDVFSDGCPTGKITNWLLGCGSGGSSENTSQQTFESVIKANNFDDEMGLGADASVLNGGEISFEAGFGQHYALLRGQSRLSSSTPHSKLCPPSLNLGHSLASSCLSFSTCKTSSSVSEVLQMCSDDAEETLYELGFGFDEPQVTVRIPSRFFTFPSQAKGINFRLFLDSQLCRIREEDPSLSLASRFRQVQVLTAMANAFYSLYSHVSRTPVQKLATPEFTFSSPVERIERFRSSVRSEPRSPVERLKDTVSKMCLYTGSPRGSDSTSPQTSPRKRSSLPDVVDSVLVKIKSEVSKRLDMGEFTRSNSALDVSLVVDDNKSCLSGKEKQTQRTMEGTESLQNGNKLCHNVNRSNKQTISDDANENSVQAADLDRRTHSMRSSLASTFSGETVIEIDHHFFSAQVEQESKSPVSGTATAGLKPVAKVIYDRICPLIVESVHQAPFGCQHTHNPKTNTAALICSDTESTDTSCLVSHKPCGQSHTSVPYIASSGEDRMADTSRSLPVLDCSNYCITVTGWDGDHAYSDSSNAPDSRHSSTVSPVQTCEELLEVEKSRYLNPPIHQISNNLKPLNSFELEEVQSAGEEECAQPDATLCTKHQHKGEVVRGDSVQSDSSGYAEEEVSPSSDRGNKRKHRAAHTVSKTLESLESVSK
ncbi:protein TESPA1 isoform X1 [Echeneis naucrates]|uniref:protein TESPA1 isoform X1 n=1 Tax=Echeneis naucrates TaxID=173247 RepID=UPI0011139179|nr:protein TESPA1 isoform X1 [Echeneis naucrates]XP_029357146.1 protein TESPA1 isoform X1 [Echeneis naucrates]